MANTRLLKDVLFVIIVALIGYMGFRTYQVYQEFRSDEIQSGTDITGLDQELADAVVSMEEALKERQNFAYNQSKDPMDATMIIEFDFSDLYRLQELQARNKEMRLSCTVMDENPSAVVSYMGQSFIVHVGESIGDKEVVEITQEYVKFDNGDVLYRKSAPSVQELMREG